jgi:Protein of unknown function (DUF2480)
MEGSVLINKVAESGLITINLEDFYPLHEIEVFDIKDFLFQGLILREKDFRESLKSLDFSGFQKKIVLIQCSTDAIIPLWAYMLVEVYLKDVAVETFHGSADEYIKLHFNKRLSTIDFSQYRDQRIVIKGCSNKPVPSYAYAMTTSLLLPHAQSIMFGEPCSTVPIFKRPRTLS